MTQGLPFYVANTHATEHWGKTGGYIIEQAAAFLMSLPNGAKLRAFDNQTDLDFYGTSFGCPNLGEYYNTNQ